jgi:hypothetical protein
MLTARAIATSAPAEATAELRDELQPRSAAADHYTVIQRLLARAPAHV